MRVSASVMAHPDRAAEVHELLAALGGYVPVHWDREGPASGNGDRIWRQARAAWQMADPGADYHVLIQDDALPCADLLTGLEAALDHLPNGALLSPYLGKGPKVPPRWEAMGRRADEIGASFVRTGKLMWGVCLAAPVALLPEMITWCDTRARVPDDMRVGAWFERTGREVWYTWPSLVDHRNVPSLTKHRAPDRIARRHHLGSAMDLDWSGPVVTDPMLVRRIGARSGPSKNRKVTSQTTAAETGKEGKRA